MLQFPAFMRQFPSPPLLPSSTLLPLWAFSHNDELLLAMEESELEDKVRVSSSKVQVCRVPNKSKRLSKTLLELHWRKGIVRQLDGLWSEIRKINSSVPVIGKINTDYKEDFDADAEDDDPDNVDESEGDEFEQEAAAHVNGGDRFQPCTSYASSCDRFSPGHFSAAQRASTQSPSPHHPPINRDHSSDRLDRHLQGRASPTASPPRRPCPATPGLELLLHISRRGSVVPRSGLSALNLPAQSQPQLPSPSSPELAPPRPTQRRRTDPCG
ncbi:uncharacterized protein A4U43_C05F18640 [Asparagus officinalis]|uniref:Uncharacterized protein n=1 Tax=Asparagus officinalis TaxID=4686 RepID=A0A5P1ESL2_ASPOF|nr:uncharacterized protein A4U43_C05F18640 [Asparagus officinalis]